MGIKGGPSTITNGLIAQFDAANAKSFRGEPTTNEADTDFKRTIQFHSQGAYNNAGTIISASEYGPDWKRIIISNRGTNFRIAQFPYINHPADITKTYSVEYDSQGLSGYYIKIDGYGGFGRINLSGPGTAQITVTSGSGIGGTLAMFLCNDTTGSVPVSESVYFRNYQVEQKSYATPFTPTTRGSSSAAGGGWVDLTYTGNDGVLTNGPTFGSSSLGSIVFDGTDDLVSVPNTNLRFSGSVNSYSIECVFRVLSAPSRSIASALFDIFRYGVYYEYSSNFARLTYVDKIYDDTSNYSARLVYGAALNPKGSWNHIIYTYTPVGPDSASITYLTNGVYNSSSVLRMSNTYTVSTGYVGNSQHSGLYYYSFEGNIANLKIYNRALTQDEMLQNFNAQRSRFGI